MKKVIALLLAALWMLSLAACGENDTENNDVQVNLTEPEGVIWENTSDSDGQKVTWYYEFTDDTFKAYVGKSYELTAKYKKEKSDDGVGKLTLLPEELQESAVGCFAFGSEMEYAVSGSRLEGNQEMTITYTDKDFSVLGDEKTFTLKQAKEPLSKLEPDKSFVENKELTGTWIWIYSTDQNKMSLILESDGTAVNKTVYSYSDADVEMCVNCVYTVDNGKINITMQTLEKTDESFDYQLNDDILILNGTEYYREGSDYLTATENETE